MNWITLALLSALFAGITNVLAKIGMEGVPSNLGTLVRTIVVVIFAAGIVWIRGESTGIHAFTSKTWLFLALSGIATGLSWLCYFAALQKGPISQIAPIDKLSFVIAMILGFVVLGEKVRPLTLAGAALILCGVMLTLPTVQDSLMQRFRSPGATSLGSPFAGRGGRGE
jgi:transporter family protein